MYLSKPTKRILNWGLTAVATVLIGDGLNRSLSNPQNYSDSELAAISKAAENGESIVLKHKKTGAMIGVLEVIGGSIVLGLNAFASSGTPDRILPKALDSEDTPIAALPPQPQAIPMLRERMLAVLEGCPALKKCLGCESLIIIAPAGSGKSSIASAIAFLRAIIRGHKVYTCDPHGEINVERGIWLIGKVFENEIDILSSAGILSARRASKADAVTSIFDEFGSLCMDKSRESARFSSDRVGDAIRNNRKFFNYYIFLCHGRDKGQMGGEAMPTGYLAAWQNKSAVLELEADYNDESEAVFSGRAKFKPPGADFNDDASYERFVIPEFLNPTRIRSEFADLFHHLQIKGAAIEKTEPQYDPKTLAMVDKALDPKNLRDVRQQMEKLYQIQVEAGSVSPSSDDDEYPDLAELSDEQFEAYLEAIKNLSDNHKKLIRYLFFRRSEQLEANGSLSIDKTFSNWARNNKFLRPQFRELLTEMGALHLVKLTDTHWKVRGSQNDQFSEL